MISVVGALTPKGKRFLLIFLSAIFSLTASVSISASQAWRDAFDHFFDTTQTMQADFVQELAGGNKGEGQITRGTMALSRPGKFRWDYKEPFAQLLVGDGQKVWLYDPELAQVTVKNQTQALGTTPAALLAGGKTIADAFELSEGKSADGLTWVNVAAKEGRESGFSHLQLGFSSQGLVRMILTDQFAQVTRIRFYNIRLNKSLDGKLFRFTPKAGVDVLQETE